MKQILAFNILRSRKILLLVFCLSFFISCSSTTVITGSTLVKDMNGIKARLESDINYAYELKDHRVGKTGYYYILSRSGVVVFHPRAVLIGSRMNNLGFVREVLQKESGCLSYGIEDKRLLIFFTPIGGENILCLSIPESEVAEQVEVCESLSLE